MRNRGTGRLLAIVAALGVSATGVGAGTLTLSLDFTGSLFGATAPVHEDLTPISLDIATFGAPVTGTSEVFGPYTVAYTALGSVTIEMPRCPAGSCTLTGTLTPGRFDGNVSVALRDGTTSQGTVTLRTDDA